MAVSNEVAPIPVSPFSMLLGERVGWERLLYTSNPGDVGTCRLLGGTSRGDETSLSFIWQIREL